MLSELETLDSISIACQTAQKGSGWDNRSAFGMAVGISSMNFAPTFEAIVVAVLTTLWIIRSDLIRRVSEEDKVFIHNWVA